MKLPPRSHRAGYAKTPPASFAKWGQLPQFGATPVSLRKSPRLKPWPMSDSAGRLHVINPTTPAFLPGPRCTPTNAAGAKMPPVADVAANHLNSMKTFIVRVVANGSVIGGCLENEAGKPLTRRQANQLAKTENDRSAWRKAAGIHGFNFDYYVDSFEPVPTPGQSTALAPG